jgi:hypothetical protein
MLEPTTPLVQRLARVLGRERGEHATVRPIYKEFGSRENFKEKSDALDREYRRAHRNALGILRVNVSLGIRTALDTLHDLRFWPAVDAWIQRRHGLIRQHVPAGADGGETWQ